MSGSNVCPSDVCKQYGSEFTSAPIGDAIGTARAKCQETHAAFLAAEKAKKEVNASKPTQFITPTLNVNIPNLIFTNAVSEKCSYGEGDCIKTNFLADYINGIYAWMIGASITIAIVMIMIGGLQFTLGAGGSEVGKGKERIMNGVTGLVLLLCVYLILNTVNPQLSLLKMVELENVPVVEVPEHDGEVITDEEIAANGESTNEVRVCSTIDACKTLCANKSTWPASNPKTIDESLVSKVPSAPGFLNNGGNGPKGKATKDVQDALKNAGKIAQSIDSSLTIHLVSAFRPLTNQIEKVCDVLATNDEKKIAGVGKAVAWPGGSNHGSGVAIDIMLKKGNSALTDPSFSTTNQNDPKYKNGAELLSKIMSQAGFVRYSKEIWHFELKSKASSYCRCSYPNCPFPAKC
ncbi:MAG: D-alanyl-D-alanine carboxypeptidase family protein [Patescibacteria group bacterium]